MGMGEQKPVFSPRHKRVRCVRCGNEFAEVTVRHCAHPAVQRTYGRGAVVCIYCCRRKPCPEYGVEYGGVVTCGMRKDNENEQHQ